MRAVHSQVTQGPAITAIRIEVDWRACGPVLICVGVLCVGAVLWRVWRRGRA